MRGTIWTIGHSNRPIEDFLSLLQESAISYLADVRRFPGSRKHPQFGREALEATLSAAEIGYRHFPELGGRRSGGTTGSPNRGWRVAAFNHYADYMATAEFAAALEELMALGEREGVAIMCSEAVPWRCHRRLIADALLVRDWEVYSILGPRQVKPQPLTPFARVAGTRLTYPGENLFPDLAAD